MFKNGKFLHSKGCLIICLTSIDEPQIVSYIASRKIGIACKRNFAKRLLRESVRQLKDCLDTKTHYIFSAKKQIFSLSLQETKYSIEQALK